MDLLRAQRRQGVLGFKEIGELGSGAVEPILRLLQRTDDLGMRHKLIEFLGYIGATNATPRLISMASGGDSGAALSLALICVTNTEAIDACIQGLNTATTGWDETKVRFAQALGNFGPAAFSTTEMLLKLVTQPETEIRTKDWFEARRVRLASIYSLGKIKDERAMAPLLTLLKVNDSPPDNFHLTLQRALIRTLAELGKAASDAVPTLERTAGDSKAENKQIASEALARIQKPPTQTRLQFES